ncbi:hypothetical protein ACUNGQ_21445, partial [Serratia sp. IR-2025]
NTTPQKPPPPPRPGDIWAGSPPPNGRGPITPLSGRRGRSRRPILFPAPFLCATYFSFFVISSLLIGKTAQKVKFTLADKSLRSFNKLPVTFLLLHAL